MVALIYHVDSNPLSLGHIWPGVYNQVYDLSSPLNRQGEKECMLYPANCCFRFC